MNGFMNCTDNYAAMCCIDFSPKVHILSSAKTVLYSLPLVKSRYYFSITIQLICANLLTFMLMSWLRTVRSIELGLMVHAMSFALVPFITFTSTNTSSMVCAHWPHGVLLYTRPDFSSKLDIIACNRCAYHILSELQTSWLWSTVRDLVDDLMTFYLAHIGTCKVPSVRVYILATRFQLNIMNAALMLRCRSLCRQSVSRPRNGFPGGQRSSVSRFSQPAPCEQSQIVQHQRQKLINPSSYHSIRYISSINVLPFTENSEGYHHQSHQSQNWLSSFGTLFATVLILCGSDQHREYCSSTKLATQK